MKVGQLKLKLRKPWDVNIYEPNEDVIDKITQDKHITEFILQDKK